MTAEDHPVKTTDDRVADLEKTVRRLVNTTVHLERRNKRWRVFVLAEVSALRGPSGTITSL